MILRSVNVYTMGNSKRLGLYSENFEKKTREETEIIFQYWQDIITAGLVIFTWKMDISEYQTGLRPIDNIFFSRLETSHPLTSLRCIALLFFL